ncbi:MAG: homoserine kinase, partial [Cyanobacteria bacterium P01_H01_bin.121]
MSSRVRVTVPGTTANIGPGFDCLGAALTLYNHVTLTRLNSGSGVPLIQVQGLGAERVSCDRTNLVYRAFEHFYTETDQAVPSVQLEIELGVPLARGLGSSATAIIAGLVGANALAPQTIPTDQLLQLAIALEGHPDNVVPALLGGCRLTASGTVTSWEICDVAWHPDLVAVVAIPDFELSTQAARQVLPSQYSRADAIFNVAHLGLLIR